jgi:hypothetical protein
VDQLRHQLAATAAQLAALAQQLLSDPPAPTTPTAGGPAIPPAVAAAMAAAADLRPGTAAVSLGSNAPVSDSSNGRGRAVLQNLQNLQSFGGWVPAPALQPGSGAPSPAGTRVTGGSNRGVTGDGLGGLGVDDIQSALDQLAHAVALLAVGSNSASPPAGPGEGQDAAGSGRAAAAAGGARGVGGGGIGVGGVPGASLRHLGRLMDQGLVGHKMDAFDPKLLQKMVRGGRGSCVMFICVHKDLVGVQQDLMMITTYKMRSGSSNAAVVNAIRCTQRPWQHCVLQCLTSHSRLS